MNGPVCTMLCSAGLLTLREASDGGLQRAEGERVTVFLRMWAKGLLLAPGGLEVSSSCTKWSVVHVCALGLSATL